MVAEKLANLSHGGDFTSEQSADLRIASTSQSEAAEQSVHFEMSR